MATDNRLQSGVLQAHAIRIRAGEDLVSSLLEVAITAMEKSGSQSAFILSAVGSLDHAKLRMANASRVGDGPEPYVNEMKEWDERLEIVSLVGTFTPNDGKHLHLSVSDKDGRVFGGHVIAGRIFTTLELVLGTIQNVAFSREMDATTGFQELVVRRTST